MYFVFGFVNEKKIIEALAASYATVTNIADIKNTYNSTDRLKASVYLHMLVTRLACNTFRTSYAHLMALNLSLNKL